MKYNDFLALVLLVILPVASAHVKNPFVMPAVLARPINDRAHTKSIQGTTFQKSLPYSYFCIDHA
jgi:hypothetical protein